ncbi:MAG: septum formation initiator family protein [Oscillospiraceae bacterium]|nr:septum formation initiator family protein [Oscillospiraceae bacterium]
MRLKRAGFVTKIVVFALIAYAAVTLINLRAEIGARRAAQKEIKLEVTEKEVANAELEYKLAHRDDDATIAEIARDELGLILPGERVFYDN